MTCIIGLEDKGRVWLGSDGYMGSDSHRDVMDRPKWFRKGSVTFGYAGDFRAAQVMEHTVRFREPKVGEPAMAYLTNIIAKAMQRGFMTAGIEPPKANGDGGTTFLAVFRGHLYVIQEDYSILRSRRGCAAIGMGATLALGALAALRTRVGPQEAITEALRHSAEWCPLVGEPFTVEAFR